MNTSFNVAGPIAQTPAQAIDTLRRANGMDGIFMFSAEGPAVMIWIKEPRTGAGGRIRKWLADWQLEAGAGAEDLIAGRLFGAIYGSFGQRGR